MEITKWAFFFFDSFKTLQNLDAIYSHLATHY